MKRQYKVVKPSDWYPCKSGFEELRKGDIVTEHKIVKGGQFSRYPKCDILVYECKNNATRVNGISYENCNCIPLDNVDLVTPKTKPPAKP